MDHGGQQGVAAAIAAPNSLGSSFVGRSEVSGRAGRCLGHLLESAAGRVASAGSVGPPRLGRPAAGSRREARRLPGRRGSRQQPARGSRFNRAMGEPHEGQPKRGTRVYLRSGRAIPGLRPRGAPPAALRHAARNRGTPASRGKSAKSPDESGPRAAPAESFRRSRHCPASRPVYPKRLQLRQLRKGAVGACKGHMSGESAHRRPHHLAIRGDICGSKTRKHPAPDAHGCWAIIGAERRATGGASL